MDGDRFDRLTRQWGAVSRRRLLAGLGGALAASIGVGDRLAAAAHGRATGAACGKNADCASGYCLPKDGRGRRTCACANLLTDVYNCGACGNFCYVVGGTSACVNGVCAVASCAVGLANCDGNVATGCETEIWTVTDCGACGNVCPGYQQPNDNVTCLGGQTCTFSCQGENYDVDGDPSNGCEVADDPIGNHTQGTAYYLGAPSNCDPGTPYTANGVLPSDTRVHENTAIIGFDTSTGSAPDWLYVTPTTSTFCQNDVNVTLQMNGSAHPTCYKLTAIAGLNTYSAQTDATGAATIAHSSGQYPDDGSVYFKIEKTCDTTVVEAPTYTLSYTV